MTDYCTLQDVYYELETNKTDAAFVRELRRNIRQVSRRIDATMGNARRPFFAPYTEQRKYVVDSQRVDSYYNTFLLNDHILAVTAVVRGSTTITSSVELYVPNNEVARALRITDWDYTWYGDCVDNNDVPPVFVTVTGVWGWHEDYSNAFDHVDDVQDAGGINATVTTVTVADADGADLDGFTPRFSPGNLIQIGSELMDVTAVDTTANELTVKRAVNGTTAAAHALNADIKVYQVDERVRRITARQAALLYARRGAFQVETLDGVGAISYPQDLLSELRGVLEEFQYV